MKPIKIVALVALTLAGLSPARAADLAGKWTAEIDTMIGIQKYTYDFKAQGDTFTGKATFERTTGRGEADLRNIKVTGDDVSFVEPFSMEGNEIPITYTGKIAGDEMKLTRTVGDFATEQFVAKRVKAPEAKPPVAK